jgi:hypothetical protein
VIDDFVRITTSLRGYSPEDAFFPFEPCDVPITVHADGIETLRCAIGEFNCESYFKAFSQRGEEKERVTVVSTFKKRFRIALSFPGEKRPFVEQVAQELALLLSKERVFYDAFYKEELSRLNLDAYLQNIYHDHSEAIVVFLCEEYEENDWCGLEWRAVRDLIKQRKDEIMLVRFDDHPISGVFGIDGFLDAGSRSPSDVARAIALRFRF